MSLNVLEKSISGEILYLFNVNSAIDTIKIDAVNMKFQYVKINNRLVEFKNSGKQLLLFEGFKKGKNSVTFSYKATPKQTLYFIGENENLQIWTQGQGKYTSHWLPSFDNVNEKVIFNLTVAFNKNFQVISNGKLIHANSGNDIKKWHYQMQKPMSSYLVMMAIGKFNNQKFISKSGIPIDLYLKPEDSLKFKSTYQHAIAIFDFLEREIGVKYPWQIYQQVPVNDFLYAGMENTTATIFSQDFVVDSIGFNDKNYINVNAHELAHQWFGNLVTAQSGKDHWLQEGFATYYALLAEKEIFGEDYFNFELLNMANELVEASQTDVIPILNQKASSLTFYKKGAWALHVLSENMGHENFKKAVKNYLKKYQFKNVTTADFLAEIKNVSNYDTENFKKTWLEKSGFETQTAIQILSKNKTIKQLFDLQKMRAIPLTEKKILFETILKSDVYYPIKQEVVLQLETITFDEKKELLELAMNTNDLKIRQTIAQNLQVIPLDFKLEYESLLQDKSYFTQKIVLENLCKNFPTETSKYLDISKNWIGFNDKDLRITWLKLAIQSPNYQLENKTKFYEELLSYTATNFDSGVRENALEVMLKINPNDEKFLVSLINATTHHKWQFVKFGKETIRNLIKKEEFKKLFVDLIPQLSEKEKINLEKLLKE